jgi:hypothetical protein
VILTDSRQVSPQPWLPFFLDEFAAFFGAEDQMNVVP